MVVLITGGTLFFLLGFLDDLKSLSPFLRLILQFLISIILWIQGLRIEGININVLNHLQLNYSFTSGIGLFFTCFFIVGIINAFNWIDGLDGLAGGIALIFFIKLHMPVYSRLLSCFISPFLINTWESNHPLNGSINLPPSP